MIFIFFFHIINYIEFTYNNYNWLHLTFLTNIGICFVISIIRIYGWIFNLCFSIFIKIFLKRSMFYTIHKIVLYSLVQWRAVIGIFNFRSLVIFKNLICNMSKNLGSIFECLFFCFYSFKSVSFFVNFFVYLFSSAIPWRYRTKFRFKKKKNENTLSVFH